MPDQSKENSIGLNELIYQVNHQGLARWGIKGVGHP